MSVLLDTNVLVLLAQPTDPRHANAQRAIEFLVARGEEFHIVVQNLYEF